MSERNRAGQCGSLNPFPPRVCVQVGKWSIAALLFINFSQVQLFSLHTRLCTRRARVNLHITSQIFHTSAWWLIVALLQVSALRRLGFLLLLNEALFHIDRFLGGSYTSCTAPLW